MFSKALCIHAHFYQPPRENPLTGEIPIEQGAAPFDNWNERIHAECYRPNALMGNFERISFNLGPTLCSWMAKKHPETLQRIIEQDRENVRRHGVGNALAQPYHHTILPLASLNEKIIQVAWGIADFEFRFGRKPQGMWLPETAVDLETLSVLLDFGIDFTILAPWQAQKAHLDTKQPYKVQVPDGRSITIFFYHQELSAGISFNPSITNNADTFIMRNVLPVFSEKKDQKGQLVLLASDGELYGHHQPLRDYFLSHLVNGASLASGIATTYPALWLKENPTSDYVSIVEDTSWSCHHGVARWQEECDCTPGAGHWKAALRGAFENLALKIDAIYVQELQQFVNDPWELLRGYIHVLLGNKQIEELLGEVMGVIPTKKQLEKIALLLQVQYERQRMFTSCGWFFEDFDRIEPCNNVAYAAQAVHLVKVATGLDLRASVMDDLKQVVSNRTGLTGNLVFLDHLGAASKDAYETMSWGIQ